MIKITKKELYKKLDLFSGATFTGEYYHMTASERENIKKWLLNEFEVEVEEPLKVAYMEFYNYAKSGELDKVYYGTAHHTTSKDSATRFGIGWCPLERLEELEKQGWKVNDYE